MSIPQSYTSFLAPITCSRVYEEVKALKDTKLMETPYVVKVRAQPTRKGRMRGKNDHE